MFARPGSTSPTSSTRNYDPKVPFGVCVQPSKKDAPEVTSLYFGYLVPPQNRWYYLHGPCTGVNEDTQSALTWTKCLLRLRVGRGGTVVDVNPWSGVRVDLSRGTDPTGLEGYGPGGASRVGADVCS